MGPAMHWLEAWNEVVGRRRAGARRVKKVAEKLRQELDLEHWPAFQESFRRMCDLLREVGAGRRGAAPSTICVLSRRRPPRLPGRGRLPARARGVKSAVWQAVCSPFRNPLDSNERRVILGAWTKPAGRGHAGAGASAPACAIPTSTGASRTTSRGSTTRSRGSSSTAARATFVLEKALPPEDGKGEPELERVFERPIEPNAVFARP